MIRFRVGFAAQANVDFDDCCLDTRCIDDLVWTTVVQTTTAQNGCFVPDN